MCSDGVVVLSSTYSVVGVIVQLAHSLLFHPTPGPLLPPPQLGKPSPDQQENGELPGGSVPVLTRASVTLNSRRMY